MYDIICRIFNISIGRLLYVYSTEGMYDKHKLHSSPYLETAGLIGLAASSYNVIFYA